MVGIDRWVIEVLFSIFIKPVVKQETVPVVEGAYSFGKAFKQLTS